MLNSILSASNHISPWTWATVCSKGEITFFPATIPVEINAGYVLLAGTTTSGPATAVVSSLETDAVLLMTGFEADMSLFRAAGVQLAGRNRRLLFDEETMETNIPGLYVAGTAAGGTQSRFTYFISTSHDHVDKIVRALTGEVPAQLGHRQRAQQRRNLEGSQGQLVRPLALNFPRHSAL